MQMPNFIKKSLLELLQVIKTNALELETQQANLQLEIDRSKKITLSCAQQIGAILAWLQCQPGQNSQKQTHNQLQIKEGIMYERLKGHKIEYRKDGRYQARFYVNGEQKTIYGKTKEACYNRLKESLQENKILAITNSKKITFHTYCDMWLKIYKKPKIKPITFKTTFGIVQNHIKKHISNVEISKMTPILINEALTKIDGRPKEYASQYLREIFKQAYLDNLTKTDISAGITKYTHKRKEGTALNQQQRRTLIETCNNFEYGHIFLFYLYTGCRKSEGLKTKISDIGDDYIRIPGTKTTNSDRIIPKFKVLVPILNRMPKSGKTLFGISEATIKRHLEELIKICKFKFTIKDLRTTFGTMCAETGINEDVIAKWMGHTTTNTTKKYYIKILSDFEKQNANIFDTHFDT